MIDPQPPNKVFKDGDRVKVRRLQGHFQVFGSRMVGKHRRYYLKDVPDTGCLVKETEAFGEDLEPIAAPEPAPELSLAPDPPAANSAPQERADVAPDAAAPAGERSAVDAIRSPDAGITLNEIELSPEDQDRREVFTLDEGAFGGELDEYSDGAKDIDHTHDPEKPMLRLRTKEIRYYPSVAMSYRDLKNIIYSAHIRGMEKGPYEELDNDTPVGVAVTKETNGAAVWVVTVRDRAEVREAQLEIFFPADRIQGKDTSCETMAIEHGVLLALRKIPIRRNDLEIMLLQVEH